MLKKISGFVGILLLATSLLFVTKQEKTKSQEINIEDSLEEINRKLSEKRRELEKKKLEVDKNYMTYEQMLKMSEEELKERGVGLRHKLGVSEGELIEMGVDPEIIEKVRGSHVQVTIIEEE